MKLPGCFFRRDVNGPLVLAVVTFHLRAYWICNCCAVREKVEELAAPWHAIYLLARSEVMVPDA
jgi:hypothetical protein